MSQRLQVHFRSNFFSREELVEAIRPVLNQNATPVSLVVEEILERDSLYGFLLPEGLGGGDDVLHVSIETILAFGSVHAFVLFAKGFLTKAGELVAEKLFRPLSRDERERAIARYRESKSREYRDEERPPRGSVDADSSAKSEGGGAALRESIGEEGKVIFNATYFINLYVEEADRSLYFSFDYEGEDEAAFEGIPAVRPTQDRFREALAMDLARFSQMLLAEEGSVDHREAVAEKRRQAQSLAELSRRQ